VARLLDKHLEAVSRATATAFARDLAAAIRSADGRDGANLRPAADG
jgi:hypothetical protein